MTEPLRDRFAAILRMHFASDDPGSMSAIAARDGEPLVDEDWLLVADELLAASPPEPAKLPAGHPDTWPGGTMHMTAPDPGIDAALDEQDRGAASVARDLRLAAALRTPKPEGEPE